LGQIAIAYGGRIAEEIFCDDITTGASNDIQQATNLARKMVMEWGMSEKVGLLNFEPSEDRMFLGGEISKSATHSDNTSELIDKEVDRITQECYEIAKKVILENKDAMHRIAEHLLEYETLTGEEVRMLVDGKELERKPPSKHVIRSVSDVENENTEADEKKTEESQEAEGEESKAEENKAAMTSEDDDKDIKPSGNIETTA
jgi:cell division protease FtsH